MGSRRLSRIATSRFRKPPRPRRRLSLNQYLDLRLGPRRGRSAWLNFFIKPFGARSFAEFWRIWNPVYSYYLYYFCYRPLSRMMPRPAAMMVTFITCGFLLHDIPAWLLTRRVLAPGATLAFAMFGLGAVIGDRFEMDLSLWSTWSRATANVVYLTSCITTMILLVLWIAR